MHDRISEGAAQARRQPIVLAQWRFSELIALGAVCALGIVILAIHLATWGVQARREAKFNTPVRCVVERVEARARATEDGVRYRPEVTIQYEINGESYATTTYDRLTLTDDQGFDYSERATLEALAPFEKGRVAICWARSDDPTQVVLVKRSNVWGWIFLIIPTLLRKVKKYLNDETLIILSLGLCLGMVLTAEEAGFSSALGAFVMGTILAETVESHRIEHLMTPLKNVFAAIFFVSVGMMINPSNLVEYWPSILLICAVIIIGMILFGTLGCWWGGETMRDAMQTGFSFVQIGEFSFIIAGLGGTLGVLHPAIYPIIVAASVVTTFLTPYIMKASVPCYNFLYKHASERFKAKLDAREAAVAAAEQASRAEENGPSVADKVQHAVRKTFITKRVVNLFIKNMSENDKKE